MSNILTTCAAYPRLIAKLIPVASAACMCCTAWAQEAPSEDALPAVSVKATRKKAGDAPAETGAARASTGLSLTARETPQSVSTVTREQIEQRSLTSVDAVLRTATGIHVSLYDSQRPLYFTRGFEITDFQVDGLPTYSADTNREFDTAIYERVDIVRGANGILTGVGTPSATINLIRKRPTRTFEGTASLTVGSWDLYRAEVDLNVPLNQDGSVRSRWVVAPQKRHSFRDRYEEERYAMLGVVEADIGRDTVASVGYQRQRTAPKAGVWGTIPRFTSDGAQANLPRSTSFSPDWTRWSRESETLYATIDHQFNNDWSLKASYNHTEGKTFFLSTYVYAFPAPTTGTGVNLIGWINGGHETQDTLDARLSGRFDLLGRKHDLNVGVSSLRGNGVADGYRFDGGSYVYAIPNVFTWDGSAPTPVYSRTGAYTRKKTSQDAIYGSARWRLADPLSLLTGMRVTNWRRHTDNYNTSGSFTGPTDKQSVEREASPFLGLVYDITDNLSLYASHTGIFNPQDYKDKYEQPLAPSQGTSDEIGIKGEWPAQGISASFAVFKVKQDNFGVLDSTQPPYSLSDGSSAYVNLNGTKSNGWEADLAAQLTSAWQLTAGVTKVNTARNANDLTYANVPEWLVKLGTQYRFSGTLQPLEVGAQLQWQGRMDAVNVTSPSGPTTVTQSPFGVLNLNASWRFNEATSVNLAINNALDKKYWATLDYPNYGEPRYVSLTLRTKF